MFPLFESVCVVHGEIQHASWHQRRYETGCMAFFQQVPASPLFEGINVPEEYQHGKYKLKILYNQSQRQWQFDPYIDKRIASLQLVQDNAIDYELKYTNRNRLNECFQQRGACDDVLIVKNGLITDSSYGNIVLFDGHSWHTPVTPLLGGTARERLLDSKKIKEASVTIEDVPRYKGFKLINAMRDFDEVPMESIDNLFPLK